MTRSIVPPVRTRALRRPATSLADDVWVVFWALVVLNAADLVTTMAVLAQGGVERNPIMQPLVESAWPAVVVKVGVLAVVALLLDRCRGSRRVEIVLAAVTGWYLAVVSWNLGVLALA